MLTEISLHYIGYFNILSGAEWDAVCIPASRRSEWPVVGLQGGDSLASEAQNKIKIVIATHLWWSLRPFTAVCIKIIGFTMCLHCFYYLLLQIMVLTEMENINHVPIIFLLVCTAKFHSPNACEWNMTAFGEFDLLKVSHFPQSIGNWFGEPGLKRNNVCDIAQSVYPGRGDSSSLFGALGE